MSFTDLERKALRDLLAERYVGPSRLFAYGERIGWYVALNYNPQPLRESGAWRIQCGPVTISRGTMRKAIKDALNKIRSDYSDLS